MSKAFLLLSIFVFFGALSAQAAPLCRETLMLSPNVTNESLETAIQSLAEMKLSLDTSKSLGKLQVSAVSKHAALQFKEKYLQLVKRVQGQLSEKDLRNRIRMHIELMQKKDGTKEREAEKKLIQEQDKRARPFILEKSHDLGELQNAWNAGYPPLDNITHLPKQDMILEAAWSESPMMDITLIDVKTGHESSYMTEVLGYRFSANRAKAIFIFEDHYEIVNFGAMPAPEKVSHPIKYGINPEVSADLSRIAFVDRTHLVVVDTATGTVIKNIDESEINFHTIVPKFIDNDTLLLHDWVNNKNAVGRLDLKTMKLIELNFDESFEFLFSPDRSQITVFIYSHKNKQLEASVYSSTDFSFIKKFVVADDVALSNRPAMTIDPANSSQMLFLLRGKYLNLVNSMDPKEIHYNFDGDYNYEVGDSPFVAGADISADGKSILIRYNLKNDSNGKTTRMLDVWRANE